MAPSPDLAVCYQILELPTDATEQEIKLAYRQLARRYHPDVNPGDPAAEARFKQIAQAYQTLLTALKQLPQAPHTHSDSGQPPAIAKETRYSSASTSHKPAANGRVRFYVVQNSNQSAVPPSMLSPEDSWFKVRSLKELYGLMKRRKWRQTIRLAEGLAARFPGDPDVSQWLALAYHRWAKNLIDRKQYQQARVYLKKALTTDPHNRKLWTEIEQDYKLMERQLKL